MTFLEKIKTKIFWINVLKIAFPFFIIVLAISLLVNSFSSVINLDIETLKSLYISEGKWKFLILPKIIMSIAYGIWISQRNMK